MLLNWKFHVVFLLRWRITIWTTYKTTGFGILFLRWWITISTIQMLIDSYFGLVTMLIPDLDVQSPLPQPFPYPSINFILPFQSLYALSISLSSYHFPPAGPIPESPLRLFHSFTFVMSHTRSDRKIMFPRSIGHNGLSLRLSRGCPSLFFNLLNPFLIVLLVSLSTHESWTMNIMPPWFPPR